VQCPACGLENPPSAIQCDCGYNFETGIRPPDVDPTVVIKILGYCASGLALLAPWIVVYPFLHGKNDPLDHLILLTPAACGGTSVMCGIIGLLGGYPKRGWQLVIIGIVAAVVGTALGLVVAIKTNKLL
jgi:hypothetical protein